MRRILHCIPSLGTGGAERQLVYLANSLVQKEWQVHIALGQDGPMRERLSPHVHVHALPWRRNHSPLVFFDLFRLMLRVKPDIVQTWLLQMDVFGGAAAQALGIPWIVSERSSELAYPRSLKTRLRMLIGRGAQAVAANSEVGTQYWEKRCRSQVIRRRIGNAVPMEQIAGHPGGDDDARTASGPCRQSLVLYVGRLSPEKNLSRLIDALALVVRERHAAAVFCGTGPLEQELREQAAALRLADSITFQGYVADVWPLMRRASAFVSVSHFEGQPNAVLEAMAAGCPVVLSDIPSHRELANDEAAVFVDGTSAEAIAAGIARVLDAPAEARMLADAARQTVSASAPSRVAAEYDRLYFDVLEGRQ